VEGRGDAGHRRTNDATETASGRAQGRSRFAPGIARPAVQALPKREEPNDYRQIAIDPPCPPPLRPRPRGPRQSRHKQFKFTEIDRF